LPTFDSLDTFQNQFGNLTPEQVRAFYAMVRKFVADLKAGRPPRRGLRVKGVQGHPGIFEITWAPDGRATFEFGEALSPGDPHIIWRRVGTHDIFTNP